MNEAERSLVRSLDGAIRNCRHGGPSESEQETPWFQECNRLALWNSTPTDALLTSPNCEDDEIIMASITTISVIIDMFPLCLPVPQSRKYFAALAVDAWFNEDY